MVMGAGESANSEQASLFESQCLIARYIVYAVVVEGSKTKDESFKEN